MANAPEALKIAKRQLRKTIQSKLKPLSQHDISKQSLIVHERLSAMPEYQSARNISIFLSMPAGEISTSPIVKDAMERGKKVFVPYIYKSSRPGPSSLMDMVALKSDDDYDSLKPDKWGIPTPDEASVETRKRCICSDFGEAAAGEMSTDQEVLLEKLDMIVVPSVAFDMERRRLGHGKGYYDVFLSRYDRALKSSNSSVIKMPYLVGISLEEQMLPSGEDIPTDSSDWLLDTIIAGSISVP